MAVRSVRDRSNGRAPANRRNSAPVVLHTRVVTGTGGGPDKTILNSPRFLEPFGYRTVCAYMRDPADRGFASLQQKAARWRAPLLAVPDHGPLDLGIISRFLTICRREKVTIWHGHDYKSNLLGLLLRRFWPMHLVTTVHGWVKQTRRTPLYYGIDRLCLPHYDRVICVSEDLRQACLQAGVRDDRCILVHNAIDTEEFVRQRPSPLAKPALGIPPERLVVGAVGRLSPEKGFDRLVRATQQLLGRWLDLQCVIVGEGDDRPRLESLIQELGLSARVQLLGFHADVRPIYEVMDVYALSSLREGLPNVVLEAMAMEVPVVATRVAGLPQMLTDGVNGLLVEPDSVPQLTQALGRVLTDADCRAELGRAGRKLIETQYSFSERMRRIRGIYDELLMPKWCAGTEKNGRIGHAL